MIAEAKQVVKEFWEESPCGTIGVREEEGTLPYFEKIEEERYALEPFIHQCAQFTRWRGKRVLEVGCGAGTDFLQFARAGAEPYGVDLTIHSVKLAWQRLRLYSLNGILQQGDSEHLPFHSDSFDLVYSWGVIHHTPNTEQAIEEIYRVTKPGGQICIMIYHRFSWVVLELYLRFGLLCGRPFQSLSRIVSEHMESTGTKAYTRKQARRMFTMFSDYRCECFVTPYDRKRFPKWLFTLFPSWTGWFMVIRATKPHFLC